jgi:hypothetical protein
MTANHSIYDVVLNTFNTQLLLPFDWGVEAIVLHGLAKPHPPN